MEVTPSLGASASHLAGAFADVRTTVLAETAHRLGISLDQLRAELAAGRPLAHIAALAGVSTTPAVVQDEPHGAVDVLL